MATSPVPATAPAPSPTNGPQVVEHFPSRLGESFLTWDGSQYSAHGSGGGHSDFAPTDERQIRLLHCLVPRFGHVGVERVCSGIGVPNIYEFLRDQEKIPERPEIAQSIASAKNHTKAIVEAAVDPQHPSELCLAMVDLLVSILANEAGNLALKVLATGGVYLAGGIALHLVKLTATTAIRADLHQKRTLQRFNGTDAD
jgi:glucokinase